MKILFSPLGAADPLSQLGDGPMLHIVRHYCPDKVVLFLSPAMGRYHGHDDRYRQAIEGLCKLTGQNMPLVECLISEKEEVHRYDHYIKKFEQILKQIRDDEPKASVLVNVTSGTPAMQQALVALGAFGRLGLKLLQVDTPRKGSNKKEDREDPEKFDLEILWELNPDNDITEPSDNRVFEVELPNFGDRLLRENVISLVQQYDYAAAEDLVAQVSSAGSRAKELIEGAAARLNLDGQRAAAVFGGSAFPYRSNDPLAEYLYMLEVRLAQKNWADFVRSMTPALTETIIKVLNQYISEDQYLWRPFRGKSDRRVDMDKVLLNERLSPIFDKYSYSHKHPFVENSQLIRIAEEYCEDAKKLEKLEALRHMEKESRNLIAHEIRRVDKDTIEKNGGISLERVMKYFFDLNDVEPGLYSRINKDIVRLI